MLRIEGSSDDRARWGQDEECGWQEDGWKSLQSTIEHLKQSLPGSHSIIRPGRVVVERRTNRRQATRRDESDEGRRGQKKNEEVFSHPVSKTRFDKAQEIIYR